MRTGGGYLRMKQSPNTRTSEPIRTADRHLLVDDDSGRKKLSNCAVRDTGNCYASSYDAGQVANFT